MAESTDKVKRFLERYGKHTKKVAAPQTQSSDDTDVSAPKNNPIDTKTNKQTKTPITPAKKRQRIKPQPERVYQGENPDTITKKNRYSAKKRKNISTKEIDKPQVPPLQKKASSAVKIALFTFLKDNNKGANITYIQALQEIPAQKIEIAYEELAKEIQLTEKQQKSYQQMLKNVKKYQYEKRKKQREKSDTNNQSDTEEGDNKMADTNENKEFTLNDEQKKFLEDNHIEEQPKSEEAFNTLKNEYENKLKEALSREVQRELSNESDKDFANLKAQKENDDKLIEKSDRSLVNKLLSDMENDSGYDQDAVKAVKKRYPESLNVSEENTDKTKSPVANTPQQDDADWVKEKDEFYKDYAEKHPAEFKYKRTDENVKDELIAEMNGAKVHYTSKDNVSVSKEANIAVFEAMLQDPHNQGRVVNFAENMSPEMQARLYAACLLHGNELGTGAPQQLSEEQLAKIKEDLGEERYAEFEKLHKARQPQHQQAQQQGPEEQKFDKEKISAALDAQVEMAKLANKKDRSNDENNRLTELEKNDRDTKAFLAAQYALDPEGFKGILKEKLTIKTENINNATALREAQVSAIRATKDQEELAKKEASRQDTRALMAYKMGIIDEAKAQKLGIIDKNGNAEHIINTGKRGENDSYIVVNKGDKIEKDANVDKKSDVYKMLLNRFNSNEK